MAYDLEPSATFCPYVFCQDGFDYGLEELGVAVSDQNDAMMLLGKISEGLARIREDFTDERKSAAGSRKQIHARLDSQAQEIAMLKSSIELSAQISEQTRERIERLSVDLDEHKESVGPSVEEWQRMKKLGVGIAGLLAIGGLSVGAMLVWFSETSAKLIKHWLGLE